MASVTLHTSLTTSVAGTLTTPSFTPAANDLLVVFVIASNTLGGPHTLSGSTGLTFTQFNNASCGGGAGDRDIWAYVADALASAVSQTLTWAPGDASTGQMILVFGVSGITNTGALAIRQSAKQESQAAGGTPAPAFSVAALTTNPVIGVVGNETNPAGVTEPSTWAEAYDNGYGSPDTGGEAAYVNSGFTGTTVTWGSTSASTFGSMIAEVDASAPAGGQPTIRRFGLTKYMASLNPTGHAGVHIMHSPYREAA